MNTTLLAWLGWPEIIGILVIVLVLFGAKRVPELMRGMGHGIKEFKKATREVQDEVQRAIEEEPPPPEPPPPAPRKPASAPDSSEAAVPKA
ncbi:MAG TPA: twin-arginine translocase TatA/TatE family subunit [Verrucomicrobiae bacterium]|nr:twin-arginine translocase TatA/TatE family subunit [Verrucomicrobiae bacterium]